MEKIISVKKKFMQPVKLILSEAYSKESPSMDKYSFTAVVLVWDPMLDYEWSIVSRNGVRYNREHSINVFKKAIKFNNGIPFLYNHDMSETIEQLGLVTEVEDTGKELVIKGFLNGKKQRVIEEILPGYLNNVSLQVDGERQEIFENGNNVVYAKPTDVFEISAVPVQGIPGANMFDIALCEAVKSAKQKEALSYNDEYIKAQDLLVKKGLTNDDTLRKMITFWIDKGKSAIEISNIIKENLTTSNTAGASTTLLRRDEDDLEEAITINKSEIEDELSDLEENIDEAYFTEIMKEAQDELNISQIYAEALKEASNYEIVTFTISGQSKYWPRKNISIRLRTTNSANELRNKLDFEMDKDSDGDFRVVVSEGGNQIMQSINHNKTSDYKKISDDFLRTLKLSFAD